MRATRRRSSTTEHGHAVSIRGYQSDPWSVERPLRSAPRSYPARAYGGALTGITPYQLAEHLDCELSRLSVPIISSTLIPLAFPHLPILSIHRG
jgi:hypothetical protein